MSVVMVSKNPIYLRYFPCSWLSNYFILGLCESCVETLFAKGSGACPECEIPLRRGNFKLQLFEDATIDKEVEIRRRILRDFCKTQEDFSTLREYNDYLEEVEDIIFNLANNIDVEETKRKIQDYKDYNKDFIKKNQNKISAERIELEDILNEERRIGNLTVITFVTKNKHYLPKWLGFL